MVNWRIGGHSSLIIIHDRLLSHIAKYWLYLSLHKDNTILRIVPLFNWYQNIATFVFCKVADSRTFLPQDWKQIYLWPTLELARIRSSAHGSFTWTWYSFLHPSLCACFAFFPLSVIAKPYQRHSKTDIWTKRQRFCRPRVRLSRFSRDVPIGRPGRRDLARLRSRGP